MPPARTDPDRLFVKDGFKHYRRTYSLTEVRWGLVVLAILVGTGVYVWWRGQHPDPELFGGGALAGGTENPPAASADRGPVPADLAAKGWSEGDMSQFTADNLYVKINGRADYFLSKGFERLYFVPLRGGAEDDAPTVDVEIYDLASPANALGAFSGESKDGAPESTAAGLKVYSRNALFFTHGPLYVRAIGSEESEVVTAQLRRVDEVFAAVAGDAAGDKPWAYALFEGQLGLSPGAISYARENAFSFEFARDVYSARYDDDAQVFVMATGSEAAATALAAEFVGGFESYGEDVGDGWIEDKYIHTVSTAVAVERWVLGVRGAPDVARGKALLAELTEAFGKLDAAVKDKAVPAEIGNGNEGGDDGQEQEHGREGEIGEEY